MMNRISTLLAVVVLASTAATSSAATNYGDNVGGLLKTFFLTDSGQTEITRVSGLAFDPTHTDINGDYDRVYLANRSSNNGKRGLFSMDIFNETTSSRLAMGAGGAGSNDVDNPYGLAVDSNGTAYLSYALAEAVWKVTDPSGTPTEIQMLGNYGTAGDQDPAGVSLVPAGFGGSYTAGADLVIFEQGLELNNDEAFVVLHADSTEAVPHTTTLYQEGDDGLQNDLYGDTSSVDGYAYAARRSIQTADLGGTTRPYIERINGSGTLQRMFLNVAAADIPSTFEYSLKINPADGSAWFPLIDNDGRRQFYRADVANATDEGSGDFLADLTLEINHTEDADSYDVGRNSMAFSPDGKFLVVGAPEGAEGEGGQDRAFVYSLETLPVLTVDRDTGNISIGNDSLSDLTNVIGYKITSESGALNPSEWLSITDNYDAGNAGPNQVDPDNNWSELTDPGSRSDLSEAEFEGNGGANNGANFLIGNSTNLGNAWIKYFKEDVSMELLYDNGDVLLFNVAFTGNGDNVFVFGDLDFDGDIDETDFTAEFIPDFNTDTTLFSEAEKYNAGDFNEDGITNEIDFLIFNQAYMAANPGAGSLTLKFSVPEPSTAYLLLFSLLGFCVVASRKAAAQVTQKVIALFAFVALSTMLVSTASAELIAHWELDEATNATTAVDSTGNGHTGTKNGNANSGATGIIGNAWDFSGANGESGDSISITTAPGTLIGLGETFTYSGWVKTEATSLASLFSISNNAEGSREVLLRAAADLGSNGFGTTDLLGRPDIGNRQALSTTLINDGQWHFLVFAQDSVGWSLYVDGVAEDTGVAVDGLANPSSISANSIHIGANDDSGTGTQWAMNGLIDDMAVWDNRLTNSEVEQLFIAGLSGVDAATEFTGALKLRVNETNGGVSLLNDSGFNFEIDTYRIISPSDELANGNWASLDSTGVDGDVWSALLSSTGKVSEGALGESTVMADSMASINLGGIYSGNAQNLIFEYHIKGTDPNLFYSGDVDYVTGSIEDADFDSDGDVDGSDFLAWQTGFGTSSGASLSNGDANADGAVDASDFSIWSSQFGNTSGGGSLAGAAVPEPSTLALLLAVTLATAAFYSKR